MSNLNNEFKSILETLEKNMKDKAKYYLDKCIEFIITHTVWAILSVIVLNIPQTIHVDESISAFGKYNIIEIPSVKKRVFMDSDYSVLLSLKDGE